MNTSDAVHPATLLIFEAMDRLSAITDFQWSMRPSVLALREADYQWRQMEWIGFYFEHLMAQAISGVEGMRMPGDRVHRTRFDLFCGVDVDLKAHAANGPVKIMLNDARAVEESLALNGALGFLVLHGDVEYDVDGSDREWHNELKGGPSAYMLGKPDRKSRRRKSEFRGTHVDWFLIDHLEQLQMTAQGLNANGSKRPLKYALGEDTEPMIRFVLDPDVA